MVKASERREKIKKILSASKTTVSASLLAESLNVSRQIIVGDIALLRAEGMEIKSTPRGYILSANGDAFPYVASIVCKHSSEELLDELYTIVDYGGTCIDVKIDHSIYGQICGQLDISSRYEAQSFFEKISEADRPLSALSGGIHEHRIGCRDKEIFNLIQEELRKKKILVE